MHHDELWQEYSETGEPIGQGRPRSDFEDPGTTAITSRICGAVHVWLYRDTPSGRELLFQKRSQSVSHNPRQWDISAAGHINAGESYLDAALRECSEEIGATIAPQELKFVLSHFAPIHRALFPVFLYKWEGPDTFQFDDGEVETVQWVPISDVPAFVQENVKHTLAELSWYWEKLLFNLEHL